MPTARFPSRPRLLCFQDEARVKVYPERAFTSVKDSEMRAFGIGHWNRLAAARTSRRSPGMAGILMHVHPGRHHAARTATSQFQRPLRGNPMPNAFHPRRRLTTLRLHRLAKAAEEVPRRPHAVFWSVSTGSISSISRLSHSQTHSLTLQAWGKQRITRSIDPAIIGQNHWGNGSERAFIAIAPYLG